MSKILDRIRKLLAVADDERADENEADAARFLAEQMMEAANICEFDLLQYTRDVLPAVGKTNGDYINTMWMLVVTNAISKLLGVSSYTDMDTHHVIWVGTVTQRETAVELSRHVEREVDRLVKGLPRHHTRDYKRMYRLGIAKTIRDKADAFTAEPEIRSQEHGLVLVGLKNAIAAALPKNLTTKTKTPKPGPAAGYKADQLDGQTIQLQGRFSKIPDALPEA